MREEYVSEQLGKLTAHDNFALDRAFSPIEGHPGPTLRGVMKREDGAAPKISAAEVLITTRQ
jgi:hypothetical protein